MKNFNRRFGYVALGFVLSTLAACATNKPIDANNFIEKWVGIFEADSIERIPSDTSPTGMRSIIRGARPIIQTTRIVPRVGMRFGFGYQLTDEQKRATGALHYVWRYPKDGIRNPLTDVKFDKFEYQTTCTGDKTCVIGYSFTEPWEMVPGIWTLELWQGINIIHRKNFEVILSYPECKSYPNYQELGFECSERGFAYIGIGLELTKLDNGDMLIVAPIKDGPAHRAGLLSGDIVVSIQDADVKLMSLQQAAYSLRGSTGSIVKILVIRTGHAQPIAFQVVREVLPPVKSGTF